MTAPSPPDPAVPASPGPADPPPRPAWQRKLAACLFFVPGGLRAWRLMKDTPLRLGDLRRSYDRSALDEAQAGDDPLALFERWLADAVSAVRPPDEPNAMTLATVQPDGTPAARTVLLKGFDRHGLVFYTNRESRKGAALAARPDVSLLFWWAALQRQVEILGTAAPVDAAETAAYFHSRPVTHQAGAWASRQSTVIASRAALEERIRETMARFAGREIPVPPFWGGYRITPRSIEFWQGRPSRLHDRLRYTRRADGGWDRVRLSP